MFTLTNATIKRDAHKLIAMVPFIKSLLYISQSYFYKIQNVIYSHNEICKEKMLFPCGVSRSGTTLLTAILDSHTKISLGYELVPPVLPPPAELERILNHGMNLADLDFKDCGPILKKHGWKEEGRWLARCHRAGATAKDMMNVLTEFQKDRRGSIRTFPRRLRLASEVAHRGTQNANAAISGFKYSSSCFELGFQLFPNGFFINIVRDPRDVVASQRQRSFPRSLTEMCCDWIWHTSRFIKFKTNHPLNSYQMRYEDLVTSPEETLISLFQALPIKFEDTLLRFHKSDASIFLSKHPNLSNLKKGFFTESIGRWSRELSPKSIAIIEKRCAKYMKVFNYEKSV